MSTPAEPAETVTFDTGHFRRVLGHFATGVAIITAAGPTGPAGMVVSSFTSVSLEPPLVAFLPDKSSTSWPSIEAAGSFCVNVLSAGQEEVCRQFARKGVDKYAGISWRPAPSGAPVLEGVMAWIDCDLVQTFESGDHYIAIGQVRQLDAVEGVPLVFFQGAYAQLDESPASASSDAPEESLLTPGTVTLAELARLTGTDTAALAEYARSTDGLVDEIVGGYVRSFHDLCLDIERHSTSARDGIRDLVDAAFDSMAANRVAIMILQHERPYLAARADFKYLTALEREIDRAWLSTLRRGVESGELRAQIEPETTYRFIQDIMFATARWYSSSTVSSDVLRHVRAYRELLLAGLLN